MSAETFRIKLSATTIDGLRHIGKKFGRKTYETIRDLINDLATEPDKKGEALKGRLKGLYSRHYSRFRIIYLIRRTECVVLVVGAGFHESDSRKDIYQLISRLLESGGLSIDNELRSDSPDLGEQQ